MAKQRLKKFTEFTNKLLPHETKYLKSIFKINDNERVDILDIIHQNAIDNSKLATFDKDIDKRKYSRLLHWIQSELDKVDVDQKMTWITETQQNIIQDNVSIDLEKELLKELKKTKTSDFYFLLFYEMLVQYRHYLSIRMRYQYHNQVHDFLERYQFDYKSSKLVFEQLHQATMDIIGVGGDIPKEAIQWGKWLRENFSNDRLDGLSRYMAAVRYIFICIRYKMTEQLDQILTDLDHFFDNGQNYSKRLLVNYYSNMMIYHDLTRDYEKAKYFGYLSIKHVHQDTTIYYNNLINVLLKMGNYEEALEVIESAHFKVKNTKNLHSAIGFVANHIRCLSKIERNQEAVTKGRLFLQAYQKQILKYRWHRFFSAYHGALFNQNKYKEILKNTEQFKLHMKESQHSVLEKRNDILTIYYNLARYYTNAITLEEITDDLRKLPIRSENGYDEEMIRLVVGILNG